MSSKKIYFASDFHLGVPNTKDSHEREKKIVRWLDFIKKDAKEIHLVGDIFDFWYEYKYTIPKGTVRLLGKIAELTDSGIPIHFYIGNHDLWMEDYFETELNVKVHREPQTYVHNSVKLYVGHGDGLGPGDKGYKILRKIFTNKFIWWCYSRLHPNLAFYIAKSSSKRSRIITGDSDEKFLGNENEWLFLYCRDFLKTEKINYFIFGHRHLPLTLNVDDKATYINLGEWINYCTYAEFDGTKVELKTWSDLSSL